MILWRRTTRKTPSQIIPQIFPLTSTRHQLHRMTFSPRELRLNKWYVSFFCHDYLLISCRVLQLVRNVWTIRMVNRSRFARCQIHGIFSPWEPQSNKRYISFVLSGLSADFLHSFAIDPQLVDHPHSEQIGAVPGASRESVVEDEPNSAPICLLNAGEQSVGSSPRKSSTRDDRVRPTTYNPLYGSVEGVKRGNTDWSTYTNYHQYTQLTHLNVRCSPHETASPCRDRLKESRIALLAWNGGYCHSCKFTYIYLRQLAPCIPANLTAVRTCIKGNKRLAIFCRSASKRNRTVHSLCIFPTPTRSEGRC